VIDAVFLTWNSRDQALDCIAHLREPVVASVTCVDNASTDGTVEAVRAAYPDVRVVALESETSFAGALNRGAALGEAPFVLYLNDDVFAAPGAVRTLLEALEARPDAVAAGGRLVSSGLMTQDQYRPRSFPSPLTLIARLVGLERLWPRNPWTGGHLRHRLTDLTTVEVDQPAGACLLVRRSAVERVGGWDDRYWFWYEDVDFSRRLAAHGVLLYVPTAPFRHVGGATARRLSLPEGHRRAFYGTLRYARTHFSSAGRAAVAVTIIAVSLLRGALLVRSDRAGARIYAALARSALSVLLGRDISRPA
jgi:GT2 family glycosyltransferase